MFWFLAGVFAIPVVSGSRFVERNRRNHLVKRLFVIDALPPEERVASWSALVGACLMLGAAAWLLGTFLVPPVVRVYLS